jgi:hypothetical protein
MVVMGLRGGRNEVGLRVRPIFRESGARTNPRAREEKSQWGSILAVPSSLPWSEPFAARGPRRCHEKYGATPILSLILMITDVLSATFGMGNGTFSCLSPVVFPAFSCRVLAGRTSRSRLPIFPLLSFTPARASIGSFRRPVRNFYPPIFGTFVRIVPYRRMGTVTS